MKSILDQQTFDEKKSGVKKFDSQCTWAEFEIWEIVTSFLWEFIELRTVQDMGEGGVKKQGKSGNVFYGDLYSDITRDGSVQICKQIGICSWLMKQL